MAPSSDSEMLSDRMSRLSGKKRVHEVEEMASNRNKEMEKTGNLSRLMMCNGAERNSTSCVCVLARGQGVLTNLSPQFPSFMKIVTQLQVPGCKEQYLNLSKEFCHKHLPMDNVTVIFVDEAEKEFIMGYSFKDCSFSIGWRGFTIANRLLEGDALVFHLIQPCKFKVFVVRSCRRTKVDGAIQNSSIDVPTKTGNGDDQMAGDARSGTAIKQEHLDHSPVDSYQESITQGPKSDCVPGPDRRDNLWSDGFGGIRSLASLVKFQAVKRFEDFKICVDGVNLDLELSADARVKYYELCRSQKMFLHDHLITGLGGKLVAGMISEMLNISDAIKSTSLTPSLQTFECWDKTLKAFEDLGTNVGFLRTRIDKLVKISREYQIINQSKAGKFALVEARKKALEERISTMEALQKSIATLKESIESLEAEINGIQGKNEELGLAFKEIATASW